MELKILFSFDSPMETVDLAFTSLKSVLKINMEVLMNIA